LLFGNTDTKRRECNHEIIHVAQLSQRDRAAGWISFDQKWKTIFWRHYR